MIIKENTAVSKGKKEYPDKSIEEIREMVKKMNEEARANAKKNN